LPDAVKISISARRAMLRSAGTQGLLPFVVAMTAMKNPDFIHQLVITAGDIDGFAIYQGIGYRLARTLNNPAERCAGDTHLSTGFLV
jgi:hypothetical protein